MQAAFGRSSPFYNDLYRAGLLGRSYSCGAQFCGPVALAVLGGESKEPDAVYARVRETAAHSARDGADVAIDQVVIGSCTNGQIDDMAAAAAILKGHHLAPGVRGIIIPATQSVYRECMHRGYTDIFLDAGCIVSTPTCGPCLGGHMGILAAGERCVSTTNRNFVGRMGHVTSEVYLASPAVAAASGIAGHICHPEEVMK